MSSRAEAKAWALLWATTDAADASCLPDLPPEIAGVIEETWRSFFAALPDGAKILDLGTGGGAVLRMARRMRGNLALTGVDYADPLPDIGGIEMISGVALEKLPFPDHAFDAVTSQFAIEYADPAAVEEMARVLRPGGAMMIVAHHEDSPILKQNIRRAAAMKDAMRPNGLFETVVKLVRKGKTKDRAGRVKLTEMHDKLRARHPNQGILNEIGRLTAEIMVSDGALAELGTLRKEIKADITRLEAMQDAALSAAEAGGLCERIAAEHAVKLSPLAGPDGTPLAWKIQSV